MKELCSLLFMEIFLAILIGIIFISAFTYVFKEAAKPPPVVPPPVVQTSAQLQLFLGCYDMAKNKEIKQIFLNAQ